MKETYEAPQVEIIEANVEKGFATTTGAETKEWDIENE